jgi:hypothetical protein
MVMVGRARLALYWTRLEMYQGPARVVSRVRLGAYQAPWSIFLREPPIEIF